MTPDIIQIRLAIPWISIGCDLLVYYHQLKMKHYLYVYINVFKWGLSFRLGKKDAEKD